MCTPCTPLPLQAWVWLSVRYVRLFAIAQAQMGPKLVSIIQDSGLFAVEGFECLKSMKIHSGHSETFVISQVSAVESIKQGSTVYICSCLSLHV